MEAQKNINSEKEIESLFKAGAHFAYTKSRRHSSAKPFIFGVKNKIEIFDLEKTNLSLAAAKAFVKSIAEADGVILFVGSKNESRDAVKNGALSIDMPYVAGRWIGGTLTNFPQIRKRVMKLEDLTSKKEKGELAKYTKKERLMIDRDIEKLDRFFSGIVSMKEIPKAIFMIDSKKEGIALAEAMTLGVPVVALCGSDNNLKNVDYPIPGNDSSISSIKFFVQEIVNSYKEGKVAKPKA
ncbi:MAG: 30S ribosomal protein S2 [Parcubacteria group bacterium]|nr:30S ribosomal protein S2 [Parcubacteria group bacterium]